MPTTKKRFDRECIVVGGGIIGSTIAAHFKSRGIDTELIDSNEPMGGTAPSGGHLKPNWFRGMSKEEYLPAMDILDEHWGLISQDFQIIMPKTYRTEEVKRVNVDHVLESPRTLAKALRVSKGPRGPILHLQRLGKRTERVNAMEDITDDLSCKILILAVGHWADRIVPTKHWDSGGINLQGKAGISFRYTGQIESPFIEQWAPYKQVVAHNQNEEEIWIGDGTAILNENWKPKHVIKSLKRCKEYMPEPKGVKHTLDRQLIGIRPFIKNGPVPCFCKEVTDKVWVVTGASKLGTIAAGWSALKILKEYKRRKK